MKILGVKRSNPSNEQLGYLRAILFKGHGRDWEAASKYNVPESGEAFVHTKYKQYVETKFKNDELILAEIDALTSPGSCVYGTTGEAISYITPDDDIMGVFDFNEPFQNQEFFNIRAKLRPPLFSFLQTFIDDEEVLVGPMKLITGVYNETDALWESRLGLVADNSRYFSELKAYSAYVIPVSLLPEDTILASLLYFTSEMKVAVGLKAFIDRTASNQMNIISDASLIKIMDAALNKNAKLGRKGKRELISQVEASKKLNSIMKTAIVDLFERMDSFDDENAKILKDAVSVHSRSIASNIVPVAPNVEMLNSEILNYKAKIKEIESEKRIINSELKALSGEYEKVKLVTTFDNKNKLQELEEQLSNYRDSDVAIKKIEELELTKNKIKSQIKDLEETEQGLSDTVSRLNSDLALNTGQFRDKALSVLPFLEIMNNVKPKKGHEFDFQSIEQENLVVPQSVEELVELLSFRVIEQGFQADNEWLQLVSALYLSNKFIGYFGDPGTGKTTLAHCFRNAFGATNISSELIKVGRGWSSFIDFIGYDNSFTGEFKYKNAYFAKYASSENFNAIFQSLVFDEATLSSPEFYLSDFSTFSDLTYSSELEVINLDGHVLYVPKDTKIILTFNVDETTEQLSDRFISRMPIIHLTSKDDFTVTNDLKSIEFEAIDKIQADKLLLDTHQESETTEALIFEFENRLTDWKNLLPGSQSPRKSIQIERFLNVAGSITDLDPSVVIDFVEEVFLLPQVKGDGLEYREILEKSIPDIKSAKTKKRLAQIKLKGQKYNVFRHI